MEFNFVLPEWPKKVKTRGDDRKACKPGGRKFGIEINFVLLFQIYESYETKFPTKISSFTVHDKTFLHQILLLSYLSFFCPPPPCLFFTDQATRQISTDATSVQSQQQPKPRHSSHNVIAEKSFHLRFSAVLSPALSFHLFTVHQVQQFSFQ